MPEVSRFYGIVVKIFYDDHNPPHFHAEYGEHEALVNINTLAILAAGLGQSQTASATGKNRASTLSACRISHNKPLERAGMKALPDVGSSLQHPAAYGHMMHG